MPDFKIVGFVPSGRAQADQTPRHDGYGGKKKWFVTHPVWLICGMAVIAPSSQSAIAVACRESGRDFRKIENYAEAKARPMR